MSNVQMIGPPVRPPQCSWFLAVNQLPKPSATSVHDVSLGSNGSTGSPIAEATTNLGPGRAITDPAARRHGTNSPVTMAATNRAFLGGTMTSSADPAQMFSTLEAARII